MTYSKLIAVVLATVVCATVFAANAGAQSRGRAPGGGPTVGRAVPRGSFPRAGGPRFFSPRVISPRVIVRAPLRSFYYPFYFGYRPGISLGFFYGYPYGYYGYPYGYYGYPYGAYGYSYGGYYPAGYARAAYGGVRIQGAPRDSQVYVDGYYAGIVDDYDGTFQRLDLEPGSHAIEIRTAGRPLTYDVNVTPGQTVTIHANVR